MKHIFAKLFFSLVLLFIGLLFIEGALYLVGYSYIPLKIVRQDEYNWRKFHMKKNKRYLYHPIRFWSPKKGKYGFNKQGFKGDFLDDQKSQNELRIFVLGDSNIEGSDGSDWPFILDTLLKNKSFSSHVINAGVAGYTSYQGLKYLEEIVIYQPDLVLVCFGWNDPVFATFTDREYKNQKKIYSGLTNKVKLLQLVTQLSDILFIQIQKRPLFFSRVPLEEFDENLKGMVHLAKKHNFQLVFLARPFNFSVIEKEKKWWDYALPRYNLKTEQVAKKNQIPFINLHSYFLDKQELFVDECHFSKKGHEIAAEYVFNQLEPYLIRFR